MENLKQISFSNGKYFISDKGNVYSANKKLKPQYTHQGYTKTQLTINDIQKGYLIHRLVAIEFIPNPENKKTVNHINGIKDDNRIENLEWATQLENNRHAIAAGLVNWDHLKLRVGKNHPNSKSIVQLTQDYKFINEWESARDCERETEFHQSHINNCANGKYKKHKGFIFMYSSDYNNLLQSRKEDSRAYQGSGQN